MLGAVAAATMLLAAGLATMLLAAGLATMLLAAGLATSVVAGVAILATPASGEGSPVPPLPVLILSFC